ncbi:MAG TPA: aspartate kinase [Myxococcota bacterium]|jgi:aspartate kinase|nr:aspartate kinase [Myxococcota bacterium]
MGVVVQKYGGTSVATPEKLGRVADRVVATRAQGHQVVVVVSAMGHTTDELLKLARAVHADPPRRELDMLLSAGERISMALLAMAIEKRGVDAVSFTGSQSGIITNDRHFNARIIEVRPVRIEDELARGHVVIVAGYQGVSYKREVTTLGRGGSDTTAVALAAALRAEYCELLSDVDGVYSADPRAVAPAGKLDELTYDEVLEMARGGARVLCAQAVEWAQKAGVLVYARAAEGGGAGTAMRREGGGAARRGVVRAVAARDDLLCAEGPEGGLDALLAELDARGAVGAQVTTQDGRARVTLPLEGNPAEEALAALCARHLGAPPRREGSVTLVGDGLGDRPALAAELRRALAAAGIAVWGTCVTAASVAAAVAPGAVAEAQRLAHRRFVEEGAAGAPPSSAPVEAA